MSFILGISLTCISKICPKSGLPFCHDSYMLFFSWRSGIWWAFYGKDCQSFQPVSNPASPSHSIWLLMLAGTLISVQYCLSPSRQVVEWIHHLRVKSNMTINAERITQVNTMFSMKLLTNMHRQAVGLRWAFRYTVGKDDNKLF